MIKPKMKCTTYSMGMVISQAIIDSDPSMKAMVENPDNGYVRVHGGWAIDEAQGRIFNYVRRVGNERRK